MRLIVLMFFSVLLAIGFIVFGFSPASATVTSYPVPASNLVMALNGVTAAVLPVSNQAATEFAYVAAGGDNACTPYVTLDPLVQATAPVLFYAGYDRPTLSKCTYSRTTYVINNMTYTLPATLGAGTLNDVFHIPFLLSDQSVAAIATASTASLGSSGLLATAGSSNPSGGATVDITPIVAGLTNINAGQNQLYMLIAFACGLGLAGIIANTWKG
jgi:hypothetical protein